MSAPQFDDAVLTDIHPAVVRHNLKTMVTIDYYKWVLEMINQAIRRATHSRSHEDYEVSVKDDAMVQYRKEAVEFYESKICFAEGE